MAVKNERLGFDELTEKILNDLRPAEIEVYQAAFSLYDTNGDGYISQMELQVFLSSVAPDLEEKESKKLVHFITNGQERVTFKHFVRFCAIDRADLGWPPCENCETPGRLTASAPSTSVFSPTLPRTLSHDDLSGRSTKFLSPSTAPGIRPRANSISIFAMREKDKDLASGPSETTKVEKFEDKKEKPFSKPVLRREETVYGTGIFSRPTNYKKQKIKDFTKDYADLEGIFRTFKHTKQGKVRTEDLEKTVMLLKIDMDPETKKKLRSMGEMNLQQFISFLNKFTQKEKEQKEKKKKKKKSLFRR